MKKIIFILTNPEIPNLVKIGVTSNLTKYVRMLSTHPGVPAPFEIYFSRVSSIDIIEENIQQDFANYCIDPERTFFRIDAEKAIKIISYIFDSKKKSKYKTNPEQMRKHSGKRRLHFMFSLADVPVGAVLSFKKDKEIKATVVDDKRIRFNGKITTLSDAAKWIMHRKFGEREASRRGPGFWCYENENLVKRRVRIEKKRLSAVSFTEDE